MNARLEEIAKIRPGIQKIFSVPPNEAECNHVIKFWLESGQTPAIHPPIENQAVAIQVPGLPGALNHVIRLENSNRREDVWFN